MSGNISYSSLIKELEKIHASALVIEAAAKETIELTESPMQKLEGGAPSSKKNNGLSKEQKATYRSKRYRTAFKK